MTLEEIRQRAKLPPPQEEHHPGPPPGWVPPPPPPAMEPQCEAAIRSAVRADGTQEILTDTTFTAKMDNQSVLYARAGAHVTAENTVFQKSGGAMIREVKNNIGEVTDTLPMLRGINSAVLVNGSNTEVHLSNCQILSPCAPGDMALEAANGVFTVFRGKAFLKRVDIELGGGFGHGLYDSQFGVIYASDCTIHTSGHCASALATDQPGGDLYITRTYCLCTGPASAGIYVDGGSHAEVYDCCLESRQGEGAVLCNDGFLRISGTTLRGTIGAKLWQPVAQPGTMELIDCTIIANSDSAFVFDGGYGTVTMERCRFLPGPVQCAIESRRCPQHYDHIGRGTAVLRDCTIYGDIGASDDCSLSLKLEHSMVQGEMYNVHLTVDYGSQVVFTGNSHLASLTADTLKGLSATCPCTITYYPTEGGVSGTHPLPGGGILVPKENVFL